MAVEADPQRKGVENRDDEDTIIRKILELASQHVVDDSPGDGKKSPFSGTLRRLGDTDHVGDKEIEKPVEKVVKMKLTFWKNCFTIDDDEHSYEDPQSMKALAMLQSGHTPHAFLKLPPGTPIDMTIEYLREKNYTAERIRPFSGRAMRLGDYPSPAQGEKSDSPVLNRLELKGFSQNEPNGVVQLRLPNGSRISVNANTTQTLLELRQFVSGLPNIPLSFTILTGGRPPVHLSSLDDSKTLCETGILGSVLIVQE